MYEVTQQQIVAGLKELGLPRGAILMVHSSLSSLGYVMGGPGTVIDALLEALGPEGTLLMPTHPARDGRTFDVETIPSDMGLITETFRRRPDVLRSRHPYHPVTAYGARAREMLRDHEQSAVPDGPETPYGRLISEGGWVLHIGCDLDTLTLLHTVEAELDLPYLRELEMDYVDENGDVQTLEIKRCPGGHRGGVLQFDSLFREEGAMTVGKIEKAVCRLIFAPQAAAIMRREMERDPFFALDDNPHCADCGRFRGEIKAARLADEDFQLSAPLWNPDSDLDRVLRALQSEGIRMVDVSARSLLPSLAGVGRLRQRLAAQGFGVSTLRASMGELDVMKELFGVARRLGARYLHISPPTARLTPQEALKEKLEALTHTAEGEDVTLLLMNRPDSIIETVEQLTDVVTSLDSPRLRASYNPAGIARIGASPFYGGLYKGPLSRLVEHVELQDVVARDGPVAPLGYGNAEITEIVSSLRCRSFGGVFTIRPLGEEDVDGFRQAAGSFWTIMDNV